MGWCMIEYNRVRSKYVNILRESPHNLLIERELDFSEILTVEGTIIGTSRQLLMYIDGPEPEGKALPYPLISYKIGKEMKKCETN